MPTALAVPHRRFLLLAASLLLAAAAIVTAPPPATAQAPPRPHWGPYTWGSDHADVRAFWLFDRTGNQTAHDVIQGVVGAWNAARDTYPTIPYIAVYRDDASVGQCFVNRFAGFSLATACMIPENIQGVKALSARNPDANGHLVGGAFAVSDGMAPEQMLTAVCHSLGHVMGLQTTTDATSCMSADIPPGAAKWYTQDDADYILDVYDHSDTGGGTTTSAAPTTTTTAPATTVAPTTSTSAPATTTTAPATTTSAPTTTITLPDVTTTVPDITTTTSPG